MAYPKWMFLLSVLCALGTGVKLPKLADDTTCVTEESMLLASTTSTTILNFNLFDIFNRLLTG